MVKNILSVTGFCLVLRIQLVGAEHYVLAGLADPHHALLIGSLCGDLMCRTLTSLDLFFPITQRVSRTVTKRASPRMEIDIVTGLWPRIDILSRNMRLILLSKTTINIINIFVIIDINDLIARTRKVIPAVQQIAVTELHLLTITVVVLVIGQILRLLHVQIRSLVLNINALGHHPLIIHRILIFLLTLHIYVLCLVMQKLFRKLIALGQFGYVLLDKFVFAVGLLDGLLVQMQNGQLHDVGLIKDVATLEVLFVDLGLGCGDPIEAHLPSLLQIFLRTLDHLLVMILKIAAHCINLKVKVIIEVLLQVVQPPLAVQRVLHASRLALRLFLYIADNLKSKCFFGHWRLVRLHRL